MTTEQTYVPSTRFTLSLTGTEQDGHYEITNITRLLRNGAHGAVIGWHVTAMRLDVLTSETTYLTVANRVDGCVAGIRFYDGISVAREDWQQVLDAMRWWQEVEDLRLLGITLRA